MDNLAYQMEPADGQVFSALVWAQREDGLELRQGAGLLKAARAASCLADPQPGDEVLAVRLSGSSCYVLAVLKTANNRPLQMRADGDLNLELPAGSLSVAARGGLALGSLASMELTAPEFALNADQAEVRVESLGFFGSLLRAHADKVRLVAQSLDSVVDLVTEKLRNCFRRVEEIDRLEADTISREAESLYNARGRYSQLTAEKDVKVDGEMIHLG